jgi:hypothetical protein
VVQAAEHLAGVHRACGGKLHLALIRSVLHQVMAADGQLPGGTMTEVMGWRRNPSSGQLEWTQIPRVWFRC